MPPSFNLTDIEGTSLLNDNLIAIGNLTFLLCLLYIYVFGADSFPFISQDFKPCHHYC